MNRALCILICSASLSAHASFPLDDAPTNTVKTRFASSYFTSHRGGDFLDAGANLYAPYKQLHCSEDSRGGASTQEANENRLERLGLPQWSVSHYLIGEIWCDDNSQYNALQQMQNLTNTLTAPTNLFNGTAYTNEGGFAATNAVKWIVFGCIPYTNNTAPGCAEEIRNNAATNFAVHVAYKSGEMFYILNVQSGWSNDITSGTNKLRFGDPDQTHPGPPGDLGMAIVAGQLEMDTNVNTAIINFGAGTVASTNHCYVSSVSASASRIAFTWLADRHSMPWDHAGDVLSDNNVVTNSADAEFAVNPASTNAFFEAMTFTNLPNGTWLLTEDGQTIGTYNVINGRLDINLFNITTGSVWNQRVEVLRLTRVRRHCNEITLVDGLAGDAQGEVYFNSDATTQWNAGKRGDALITAMAAPIANLNSLDSAIWTAAAPTNHTFSLQQIIPRYAPARRF